MSASLVGSEMCIRDRHTSRKRGLKADGGIRHQCNTAFKQSVGQDRPTAPVSYTHLTLPTMCSV
eukprot:994060-Alexandrium_andersonii.AAC.1